MLKSYKELSRWYGALEPDAGETAAPDLADEAGGEPPPGEATAPRPGPADAVEGRRTEPEDTAAVPERRASQPTDETELDGIPLRGNVSGAAISPAEPSLTKPSPAESSLTESSLTESSLTEPSPAGPSPAEPGPESPEGDPAPRRDPAVLDDHDLFGGADLSAAEPHASGAAALAGDTPDDHDPAHRGDAALPDTAGDPHATAALLRGDDPRDRPHRDEIALLSLPNEPDLPPEPVAAQVTPLDAHRGERERAEADDRFDNYVPADLPSSRSEFVGGWSDWVGPDGRTGGSARDDRDDAPARPLPGPRALREAARTRQADPGRRRALIVLGVAVLLLVLAAAGVVFLLGGSGGDRSGSDPIVPTSMQFGSADAAATGCPAGRTGAEVRGAGRGGAMSGPDAVLAFQYAYYVERSGAAARQLVAPDAAVSPAEVIQKGIDTIPPGTTHCVRIVSVGDNRYSVEVTEHRPGGAPATYSTQTVTTAEIGGRTLITGIAAG